MANKNTNLQYAKTAKDDEFYTTYETIQSELSHYVKHFKDKIVLCNCDDPFESNFCKYFLKNFNVLGLKKLICTSYYSSKMIGTHLKFKKNFKDNKNGYVLEVEKFCDIDEEIPDSYIEEFLLTSNSIKKLKSDGDFRSPECLEYLKLCDIVVTNPPFSLFKEIVVQIIMYKKKYLLIGNQNALTYKEIFPLIQNNEAWTGYQFGEMKFRVPNYSEPRNTRYWVDESGQKWRSLGNAMWLTNLDIERRHEKLKLTKFYNENDYQKYDLYDAINVKNIRDIPCDYAGIMGVPITIINKFNSDQFEIVGEANHGSDNEYDLFKPTINEKEIFKRILIRNKSPLPSNQAKRINKFKILDLFAGAGGFSYGMEKNINFETIIAVDYNKPALDTFKYNMPNVQIINGDITNDLVKKEIIDRSLHSGINMIIGGPPCQGFSLKGKKLGLNDARNYLFKEYLNIVEMIQPEVFVIENVKSLLSTSAGWFKNEIIDCVKKMGYYVEYGVLTSSDFGVPQSRQRAIFICSKIKNIMLPKPYNTNIVTVRDAIYDLAYLNSNEGDFEQEYITEPTSQYQIMMRNGSKKLYNHKASKHADIAIKKLELIPNECGKEHLPNNLLGKQQFSGTWGRLKWDSVSPTIDTRFDACSNGTNNHPFLHRAITPREAARLQSFDDKFVFIGSKVQIRQQIGNAVPPLLAKAIADKIFDEIGDKEK